MSLISTTSSPLASPPSHAIELNGSTLIPAIPRKHNLGRATLAVTVIPDPVETVIALLTRVLSTQALECQGLAISPSSPSQTVLASYKAIRTLDLSDSSVNDWDIPLLKELPLIDTLNLSNTTLTDTGILALLSLPNLKSLSLNHCRYIEGHALITLLKSTQKIEELFIDFCRIKLPVVGQVAAFSSLKILSAYCTTLHTDRAKLRMKNPTLIIYPDDKILKEF